MTTAFMFSATLAAVLSAASCTHKNETPGLTGPSGFSTTAANAPVARFTASPNPVDLRVSDVVTFDASDSCGGVVSSGGCLDPVASFSWNFADGTTASGPIVTRHVPTVVPFGAVGNFAGTLVVTNNRGEAASTPTSVTVMRSAAPIASFTVSPASPLPNQTVFFNALLSTTGVGHRIVSYKWTFGDGGSGSGVSTTHAFPTIGTFLVQLTVTDETGQSNTSPGTNVTVATTPAAPPSSPTASFTFVQSSPGQPVALNASASAPGTGHRIVSYSWSLGDFTRCPVDGCSASGVTVTHSYAPGSYLVTVTVTDEIGQSTTSLTQTIIVN
jgi:hypothetical protein